jgi:hypothetical protein
MSELRLDKDQAVLIRKLGAACDDGDALQELIESSCPETASYVSKMYSIPYRSAMWRVTVALHSMDEIVGTCGVEALGQSNDDPRYAPPYEYLNTGDTYAVTLIYCRHTNQIVLGSWGDIAERHPDW